MLLGNNIENYAVDENFYRKDGADASYEAKQIYF